MTVKEFFESKEKLAIHCDNEEKAKKLLKAFNKAGYRWYDECRYTDKDEWDYYKEETCYSNKGTFGDREHFEKYGVKILEFEEIEI